MELAQRVVAVRVDVVQFNEALEVFITSSQTSFSIVSNGAPEEMERRKIISVCVPASEMLSPPSALTIIQQAAQLLR